MLGDATAEAAIRLLLAEVAERLDRIARLRGDLGTGGRLRFDDETRSVSLDGRVVAASLDPDHYRFVRLVAAGPGWVTGRDLDAALNAGGEKKWKRDVVNRLPAKLRAVIASRAGGGGGYCLKLPVLKAE